MNEASYRATVGHLSDTQLEESVVNSEENAAHGRKILAERAEAKRQAEQAARFRPGDVVRYRDGSSEKYLVTSKEVTRIVTGHYGFDADWITTINLHTGYSSTDHPSKFEKVAA